MSTRLSMEFLTKTGSLSADQLLHICLLGVLHVNSIHAPVLWSLIYIGEPLFPPRTVYILPIYPPLILGPLCFCRHCSFWLALCEVAPCSQIALPGFALLYCLPYLFMVQSESMWECCFIIGKQQATIWQHSKLIRMAPNKCPVDDAYNSVTCGSMLSALLFCTCHPHTLNACGTCLAPASCPAYCFVPICGNLPGNYVVCAACGVWTW